MSNRGKLEGLLRDYAYEHDCVIESLKNNLGDCAVAAGVLERDAYRVRIMAEFDLLEAEAERLRTLVAGEYSQADIAAIQRIANASIRDSVREEFPGLDPDGHTVSTAQIRHVLAALKVFGGEG